MLGQLKDLMADMDTPKLFAVMLHSKGIVIGSAYLSRGYLDYSEQYIFHKIKEDNPELPAYDQIIFHNQGFLKSWMI